MTVGEIYSLIDSFAPFERQEEWDNSGLLVGEKNAEADKIMLCLDITRDAAEEAVRRGASLVISHHPVIFDPLTRLDKDNPAVILAKNNIAAICAHTSMDLSPEGLNPYLVRLLFGKAPTGTATLDGFGSLTELDADLSALELAELAKEKLNCRVVRYTENDKPIRRVAVITGSGGGYLDEIIESGADAFITGDVKHDVFITAQNRGFCVVDAGHFYTENIFCSLMADRLKATDAEVFVAESSTDPTKTV